ncbi:MAG: Hsp20/alpha crystallin family protein [Oscillospiraceae bacterium]|nr:Hsp20/alpha crystallin family protein [Oscillospiraceae bacterium]
MFELIPFDRHIRSAASFDPFRMFDEMDRRLMNNVPAMSAFRTDVLDTGDAFKLECELPGFKKEDIKLDIENDCLTISAERKAENKSEKDNYVKRERFYGSFTRCFDVSGINVDGIEASYTDGMLNVTLPKKAAEIPASRRLEIK